jgi:predicted transcriptional regulator YdeE
MPEIKIKSHKEMIIVGVQYHGKNEKGEVPALWDALMARQADIPQRDFSVPAAYGISVMGPDFAETQSFTYIAGFPVTALVEDLPEGFEAFTIPSGKYAVITCPNLASLQQAYHAIYDNWLPGSEVALDLSHGNFCFELYGEEFNPPEGSETLYIYVPVKAK